MGRQLDFRLQGFGIQNEEAGLYLYRGHDGKLFRLRNDQICSNGKVILRHGGTIELLDIDSPTRTVVSYNVDVEAGKLSEPKLVVDLREDPAVPDGMIATPDEKSLIIAMFNPNPAPHGETRQYSIADGKLEQVWQLPGSPQNTCPQLVELDGKVCLVVTTAVEHMSGSQQAASVNAGSLFYAPTDWKALSDAPLFKLSEATRAAVGE